MATTTKTKAVCPTLLGFAEGVEDARDCGLTLTLTGGEGIVNASKRSAPLARARARWLADRCVRFWVPSLLRKRGHVNEAITLESLAPLDGPTPTKVALLILKAVTLGVIDNDCATAIHWAEKAATSSVKKYAYPKNSAKNLAPYTAAAHSAAFVAAIAGADANATLLAAASVKAP